MHRQSGKVRSLTTAFALAVLLLGVGVIGTALQAVAQTDAVAAEADTSWRKVTLLGVTAIVGEDDR